MVPHCARKVQSFNASPNLLVLGAWGKVKFHWNSAFKVACLQMVVDLSCSCLQFSACGVISVNGSWTVPSSVVFFQRSRGAKSTFCCWPSIQVKGEANGPHPWYSFVGVCLSYILLASNVYGILSGGWKGASRSYGYHALFHALDGATNRISQPHGQYFCS